jgi:hypothetical protein
MVRTEAYRTSWPRSRNQDALAALLGQCSRHASNRFDLSLTTLPSDREWANQASRRACRSNCERSLTVSNGAFSLTIDWHGLRRSWWVLLALFPMGWLVFAAFMSAGSRARHNKWILWGIGYLVLFWGATVLVSLDQVHSSAVKGAAALVIFIGWPLAVVHAFRIRRPFLDATRRATTSERADREESPAPSTIGTAAPVRMPSAKEWRPGSNQGRVRYWLLRAVGVLAVLSAIGGFSKDPPVAIAFGFFGLACLVAGPITRTWHRHGEVRLASSNQNLGALLFPYSLVKRKSASLAISFLGIAMLTIGLLAESPGHADVEVIIVKTIQLGLGVLVTTVGLHGFVTASTSDQVAISHLGIHQESGGTQTYISWDNIAEIRPERVRAWAMLVPVHEPLIALHIRDRREVVTSRARHAVIRLSKVLVCDIGFSTRGFDVDPSLVLAAMTFYWRNPELREELSTPIALERVQSNSFAAPEVGSGSNRASA